MQPRHVLVFLALAMIAGAGCASPSGQDTSSGDGDDGVVVESQIGRPYYLWFDDPCPPTPVGYTSFENPEDVDRNYSRGHTCRYPMDEQLDNEHPCGVFAVHDEDFGIAEGDVLSLNVTYEQWVGRDLVARFQWQDATGVVAQAVSEPYGFTGLPAHTSSDLSAVARRDSDGPVSFEAYVDGTFCNGVRMGGFEPSRFWFGNATDDLHEVS